MKKISFIAGLILMQMAVFSQIAPNKYFIRFTDKNNSPYSTGNPSEYLSQRALDRRAAQGIGIDEKDLPVNPQYLQGVAALGATLLNPSKWLNGVSVYTDDPDVIAAIEQLPYVAGVSKSANGIPGSQEYPTQVEKPFFANETYSVEPSILKAGNEIGTFDYGPSSNQIQMLNGHALHEMGYRGQGVVIAVLDAGYLNANSMTVFDSLWLNGQILGTWDFVEGDEVSFDEHPHGTMVLSTMGGNMPGQLIGTAPKASYWLLRSEDGGSEYIVEEYNWVSAAEFADSVGADIINSSLGYTTFDDPTQNHTYADMNGDTAPSTIGADIAASRGILVVNSLGNSGSGSWYYLGAPSDGDSVMGIGSVDASGNYSSFSSHGPSADGRVKPDAAAQGSSAYIADPYSGSFTYGSGTSFSSPIMAGMAACLWQANPTQTNMEIADAIRHSGSQYLNPDDELGYGIPDFVEANNILTIIDGPEAGNRDLSVYPNPFTDELRISFPDPEFQGNCTVVVSDLSGRSISSREVYFSAGSPEISVTGLSTLSPGIYFIKLQAETGTAKAIAVKR